jgi:hypothetical protein
LALFTRLYGDACQQNNENCAPSWLCLQDYTGMHVNKTMKIVHQVGFVYKIIQGCMSTKHQNIKKTHIKKGKQQEVCIDEPNLVI